MKTKAAAMTSRMMRRTPELSRREEERRRRRLEVEDGAVDLSQKGVMSSSSSILGSVLCMCLSF